MMEYVELNSGMKIKCDVSTGTPRPWVPPSMRRKVFDIVYGLSHPSRKRTMKLIKEKYIWDSISTDVKSWATTCIPCQKSKVTRRTESGIGTFAQPKWRFGHIHINMVGPLPM